jgi:predicted metal-binding membrane protein
MAMEDMAMDSMAAGWCFAGLLVFVTVWTLMMVAMMLPAATPILIVAAAQARGERHVAVPTWIFVAGYILVWAAAGLGAYVLDQVFTELLSSHASIDPGTWAPLALGINSDSTPGAFRSCRPSSPAG